MTTSPTNELTPKQRLILRQIRRLVRYYEMPPTIRELANVCGYSSTSAMAHQVNALEQKGYITTRPRLARSIRVTRKKVG
jgi:repressor LexA